MWSLFSLGKVCIVPALVYSSYEEGPGLTSSLGSQNNLHLRYLPSSPCNWTHAAFISEQAQRTMSLQRSQRRAIRHGVANIPEVFVGLVAVPSKVGESSNRDLISMGDQNLFI